MNRRISGVYRKLFSFFGPQAWWPADSGFEVMVGAILTQNTNWSNVEKAIKNLKREKLLSAAGLYRLPQKRLAGLIRPAGYYNIKAERLKEFLKFFFDYYKSDIRKMSRVDTRILRQQLLGVKGIGPETADSMLLYALNKPVFVVDAYTKRIFSRHGLIGEEADYHAVQELCVKNLKTSRKLFNEFHALLVKLGKDFCLKNKPRCAICPLKESHA